MNPRLQQLQPYPFQRLRALFAGVTANPDFSPINLSIGEPKHATPSIIQDALKQHLDGLASYPTTQGSEALRTAIQQWLVRRYTIPALNIDQEILPVNGSREALFAFAQAVINQDDTDTPIVISPNPFYQIYEGAALLAGAQPYYLNTTPASDHLMDLDSVPEAIWQRTQLIYVCTPG
ncbi:MAG: aminotransferase class I/II-fold pyridoxal phosphate-dependent enzyme, partial [Methylophilaceae bacterium]